MGSTAAGEQPVLIIGVARSGTSWLGRALGHADNVSYVFEPDNIDADARGARAAGARGFGPYPVLDVGQRHPGFEALWDMAFAGSLPPRRGLRLAAARTVLGLPRGVRDPLVRGIARVFTALPHPDRRRMVKSIYAPFAVEWLAARYHPTVVVLQRHPLNVVSSWRELSIPLFDLATRPAILDRYARPLGLEPPPADAGELARIAWCVGLLSTALGDAVERHPDWVVSTHDELCVDPSRTVGELAVRLGLAWSPEIDRFLLESDRPGAGLAPVRITAEQPQRWRTRLTASEVEEVTGMLHRFPGRGWVREPHAALAMATASRSGS